MAAALPSSVDAAAAAAAATAGRFDGLEYAENYSRFLVIGGGVAGLSAASHLARCDVRDFKLLEASLTFLYHFAYEVFQFSFFRVRTLVQYMYKEVVET